MSAADASDLHTLTASTQSLQRTLADLADDQVAEPSLLPGWTRGHVLTHLARNADAMCNLATWARTGVRTPMYESAEHRAAGIEAGARRPAAELCRDVVESADRLHVALSGLEPEHWQATVEIGVRQVPMTAIPHHRRVEVEIHHVDLDLDYTLAHLPADFVLDLLGRVAADLSAKEGVPGFVLVDNEGEGQWTVGTGGTEVTGTPASLLGWVLGRTGGIGVFSADPLPALAPWR